jgi:hypothetical protein
MGLVLEHPTEQHGYLGWIPDTMMWWQNVLIQWLLGKIVEVLDVYDHT